MTIGKKIAQGWEAEIFEWSDGEGPEEPKKEPNKVLKLYYPGEGRDWVQGELTIIEAVNAVGGLAPQVFGDIREIDGRLGYIMERIEGQELERAIIKRPWRLDSLARSMGRLHAQLHENTEPALLPVKDRLVEHTGRAALLTEQEKAAVLHLLGELPDHDNVCHGDFHPRNLIIPDDGSDIVVIDWGNTARGDPIADVARSYLLMKLGWIGEIPPLLGVVKRLANRMTRIYTGTYFEVTGRDRRLLERWLCVVAAARLSEGQPEEQVLVNTELVRDGLRRFS